MKRLSVTFILAWRNLWRNNRRTLIMLGAISIGVWAMLFMTALMRGMVNDMIRDGIRTLPGHVQAHHPDYLDDPSIENLLPMDDSTIAQKLRNAGVEQWSTRVRVPAVIVSEHESRGVILNGIDPGPEQAISFLADSIVEGVPLQGPTDKGLVIGRALADKLETRLGKKVVIMSQNPDNDIADRGFRIVGLFDTTLSDIEETMVFTGKSTAQGMLGIPGQSNEWIAMGQHYRDLDALVDKIRSALGPDFDIRPWNQLNRYLGTMLDVMDGFVLVWMVVIFLALSFGLVNTLAMAVFERVREIGLLLAIGMKPGNILSMVLVESALLLMLGLVVGNLAAYLCVWWLGDGIDISLVSEGMEMFGAASMLRPELIGFDTITANLVVMVLGLGASLLPAIRAARYQPMEALNKV